MFFNGLDLGTRREFTSPEEARDQRLVRTMMEYAGVKPPLLLDSVRMVALETVDEGLRQAIEMLGLPIVESGAAEPGATIRIRPLDSAPSPDDGEIPTIFTTDCNDIDRRLASVRRRGAGLLVHPYSMEEVRRVIANCRRPVGFSERRVLIVEDDASMAKVIALTLANAGYQVDRASTSQELIDKLDEFRPDVLLLDLHLSDCTGAELTLIIRQMPDYANTPIFYVSGETDPQAQIAALKCGADGFITKPLRRADLVGRVDAAVSRLSERDRFTDFDGLTGVHGATLSRSRPPISASTRQ